MNKKGSTAVLVITVMLFAVAITLAGLASYIKLSGLELRKIQEEEPVVTPEPQEVQEVNYEKLETIDKLIQNSYLEDYDRDQQMDAVYTAMVDSLPDEYSRYLTKEDLEELKESVNSAFTGAGIYITPDEDGGFVIAELVSGGPADVVGIKEGDVILAVDGKEYEDLDSLVDAIKGTSGTKVDLLIKRGDDEKTFSLVRGDIKGASVDSKTLEGDIGYIKIRSFGNDTVSLFETALSSFEQSKVKGLVLDLRNSIGGWFDEGIKVADRLLPEGLLSYTLNKNGEKQNYNSDGRKTDLKMVVLINSGTASSAEMIAAAIKANQAATLVGTRTYGKGLIQETHTYSDGSAVSLTTREFFAPDGSKINTLGVEPDVEIINSEIGTKDEQLEKALEILRSN